MEKELDPVQLHYMSTFNIRIPSDYAQAHRAHMEMLKKQLDDELEFISKLSDEGLLQTAMKKGWIN